MNKVDGEDEESFSTDVLLALTGIYADLDDESKAAKISLALGISPDRVSIMFDDGDAHLFVVYPDVGGIVDVEKIVQKINYVIKNGGAVEWLGAEAECTVAEMEEEILIDEEEALKLWREIPAEARTSHLDTVLSPDGVHIVPTHEASVALASDFVSATHAQLKRDPLLLELDNVPRVDVSQLETVSWTKPVVITGVTAPPNGCLTRLQLVERFGEAEVRTGNRNTLVENGFDNSKPMALGEAIEPGDIGSDHECSRIVFSPVKELPELFQQDLESLIDAFPCEHKSQGGKPVSKKFTLCLGSEGFGIGFHRHNAAMFMLVVGRKKWYMGPQATEEETPTHPGFYTSKSSHKCIQQPGEVLYVPDQWYHEIFNLEYTAGIQALPC